MYRHYNTVVAAKLTNVENNIIKQNGKQCASRVREHDY